MPGHNPFLPLHLHYPTIHFYHLSHLTFVTSTQLLEANTDCLSSESNLPSLLPLNLHLAVTLSSDTNCHISLVPPGQSTKHKSVSLSNGDDQSHVIPRITGFVRPHMWLLIEQTFSTASETNHTFSLSCYKTHKYSNQCLRGNDLDLRDGVLDLEAHEEVDAPIHANDLEAVVKNIDAVTATVATETVNETVDQEVL